MLRALTQELEQLTDETRLLEERKAALEGSVSQLKATPRLLEVASEMGEGEASVLVKQSALREELRALSETIQQLNTTTRPWAPTPDTPPMPPKQSYSGGI